MTGIMAAMAGSSSGLISQMAVGSGTYTIKATVYVDGYIAAGSQADVLAPTIGSMNLTVFKGATIAALYAQSGTGHTSGATVYIEVSGNRAAGFISSVKVNGTAIGTIGTPTYNSTPNTTTFQVGSAGITNPFGSVGSVVISVS